LLTTRKIFNTTLYAKIDGVKALIWN